MKKALGYFILFIVAIVVSLPSIIMHGFLIVFLLLIAAIILTLLICLGVDLISS
jgi:hypothetical protein